MTERRNESCPECQRQAQKVSELEARIAELEAKLAQAQKHSGNSSKPPSSDITQPRPKAKKAQGKKSQDRKRRRGAQPGHPRQERVLLPPEEVDLFWEYRDTACPSCGGGLEDLDLEPKVLQQIELKERPAQVEEHRCLAQWCDRCEKLHYPKLPEELAKAGLAGPRLTALTAFLKGPCHMSFSTIRKFFRDVVGVRISRGYLSKLVHKAAASLEDPYEQLLRLLPREERLNVDETGHKDNGRRLWTWCFRASLYTVFKISPSRGSEVLLETLGEEFAGVLGCDYFSAYRKYMRLNENVAVQFCLAHLIRDVKFLAEHPDPNNRAHGRKLLALFRKLFGVFHRREEYASEKSFRQALARIRQQLVWDATPEAPPTTEVENLAERFYRHTESYFRFITTPDVEPTNNLAEQAIRFVAIHRRLTQGTRSEAGQTWCERIWTAIATCEQQGRSVFDYLCEAVAAHFASRPAPPLAFDTS